MLSQIDSSGQEHAVASRKLLLRETKYAVIEKECLAIVWALRMFHIYLYGQSFVLQTDHRPLSWLDRMKNSNARLTRWSLELQPYRAVLQHRPGKNHENADGLSRGACGAANIDCRESAGEFSSPQQSFEG